MAREAIQNSTDAHERFKKDHPDVPFRIVFRFVDLFGEDKTAAIESLDLEGMKNHRKLYEVDPLQPGSALDSLKESRLPLRLLFVEDYGTHGLFGHPSTGKKSHLFMAMYYIGASTKGADEGGLYGFGKSALQRASRVRSVIVHSVFERAGKDPVRSRLLGFTWWPDLQVKDRLHDGRGSFSKSEQDNSGNTSDVEPFTDWQASEIAGTLGFAQRDSNRAEELGSSFLIIDPAIDPEDLIAEVERWWWPALEEHALDVQVVLPSGESKVPKPAVNSFVAQFLRPFRIATGLDEPGDPNRERLASKDWRNRSGVGGQDLGALALVVPELAIDHDGDETGSASIVALMRGPRMVVEYAEVGRRRIPLRGAFIASIAANVQLRETEPSTHDRWAINPSADIPLEATDTARAVHTKIAASVTKMAKDITPPAPKTSRSLAQFSKLMKGFLGNKRGRTQGPPSGGEPIELQFPEGRPTPSVLNHDEVRVQTRFTVRVADAADRSACPVNVICHLHIYEDESQSQSQWPVAVEPEGDPQGFTKEEDGSWTGVITKGAKVSFLATSAPYPNVWTMSLQPIVKRTGDWSDQ